MRRKSTRTILLAAGALAAVALATAPTSRASEVWAGSGRGTHIHEYSGSVFVNIGFGRPDVAAVVDGDGPRTRDEANFWVYLTCDEGACEETWLTWDDVAGSIAYDRLSDTYRIRSDHPDGCPVSLDLGPASQLAPAAARPYVVHPAPLPEMPVPVPLPMPPPTSSPGGASTGVYVGEHPRPFSGSVCGHAIEGAVSMEGGGGVDVITG